MSTDGQTSKNAVAPSDPTDNLLGYHIRRVSVVVMAELVKALRPLDLRPTQATVLIEIESNPGITQSDVGKILNIKRANMAPLVAGLIDRGYVEASRRDGRSLALNLTSEGERVTRASLEIVRALDDRFFGTLSPAERENMTRNLRTLWQSHE